MRLGIVTPIVNLNPRFDPPAWEVAGGIDDLVAVAEAADRLGYAWLGCPEHVAIPTDVAATRGGRYWDPVATLGALAAVTRSIGLLSHVVVLGYHHPLEIVKRYGTLDVISGGRVILGVGVGSLAAEFALLDAEWARRGEAADASLRTIRRVWGRRETDDGWIVDPSGARTDVPIWIGGRTRRSLRRALELGDGWIPFGLDRDALRAMFEHPSIAPLRDARTAPFEVVLAPEPPLDPSADPTGAAQAVRDHAAIGATGLALRFRHESRAHYLEQLEAMRSLVPVR